LPPKERLTSSRHHRFFPRRSRGDEKLAESNGIGIIWASNSPSGDCNDAPFQHRREYFDYAESSSCTTTENGRTFGTACRPQKQWQRVKANHSTVIHRKGETLPSRGLQTDGISIHSVRLPGFLAHQE